MNPKVAILLNTIDRYDLTVDCIGSALLEAGYPFEFLCCDNGSSDQRVNDYIHTLNPRYHRMNEKNEGCAQMHNQMLIRTDADLFVLLDNDIKIGRNNWLKDLVDAYLAVTDYMADDIAGMSGIHTIGLGTATTHPPREVGGVIIHPAGESGRNPDDIFGTRMFSRTVLNKVGYFCEEYGPYSLCDNEYNERVFMAGFTNYYISGPSGMHLGADVGDGSAYRQMKNDSMQNAGPVFLANMKKYRETGNYYIPAPPFR